MKRFLFSPRGCAFILAALCAGGGPSFAQTTFERSYGGTEGESGNSVQQTFDGGYIVAGSTSSFGAGHSDVYLIKTTSTGDTLWTRTYGGPSDDAGYSVQQTSDGGYIIAGNTSFQWGVGESYVYLIKANSSGDTLWTRTYVGPYGYHGSCVRQTFDGGYVIAGGRGIIKTDSSGNALWMRAYGGQMVSVRQTSDGGYIVVGDTTWMVSRVDFYRNVYLVNTDSSGGTLWTRTYGLPYSVTNGESVQQTSDDGYIVAGWTSSWDSNRTVFYIVKASSTGDTLWTKLYGGPRGGQGYSVQQTSDDGYVITGYTKSFGPGTDEHVYLVKTNSSGDTLWTGIYGAPNNHGRAYSVQQTSDGGYIIAGQATTIIPFGGGGLDVYLIKTGPDGIVSAEVQQDVLPTAYGLHQNYPNPFNPSTTIRYELPGRSHVTLTVFTMLGQQVAQLVNGEVEAGHHEVTFDARGLASGMYMYRMQARDFVQVEKLVILK